MAKRQLWLVASVASLVLGCAAEEELDDGTLMQPGLIGDAGGVAIGDATVFGTPGDAGSFTPLPDDAGSPAPVERDADSDAAPAPSEDDSGISAPGPTAGCLEGITNYKEKGKFTYKAETSGSVKMWVPDVPAGCKVPVVHLANGTGATCSAYGAILTHLASHGFLATCYEDTNTGQGTQCITALETAIQKHPELADDKIGSTGHSQGGGAAFVCLQRAEDKWGTAKIYAGHSMEPASGFGDAPANYAGIYAKIKSPMFMFNGSADTLVSSSWVGQAFTAMADTTEAYWYEASGAAHIPVPTRWTQESTVVWFRWKLLGDKQACEYFKKMPDGNDWAPKKQQAEKGC